MIRFVLARKIRILIALWAFFLLLLIWGAWPGIYSEAQIYKYAEVGSNVSVVVSQVGDPNEHYKMPDGSESYLYYTALFGGYVTVDTDKSGTIVAVIYDD